MTVMAGKGYHEMVDEGYREMVDEETDPVDAKQVKYKLLK